MKLIYQILFIVSSVVAQQCVVYYDHYGVLLDMSPACVEERSVPVNTTPVHHKPLVSFEEWQKTILQNEKDKQLRHKRKSSSSNAKAAKQMVDSVDGGLSDDFGSMFEGFIGSQNEKTPNVYTEGEYISPTHSSSSSMSKKDVRIKSLKERFNYASIDCAATVRKANKQAKGAQSILYESKDQYLLNKCAADKFVIINLCEQIVVDTIVMANFEFFSSTFKDFKVYASSKYPTEDWRLLGQWQARNTRDLQVFRVPDSGFVEYLKIEFLTHYGREYYCPLSLVRVHGMTMMEYYTTVESQDQDPEVDHLWPAEVREQIIQPQFDIANTSESFPIKIETEEEDTKPTISPVDLPSPSPPQDSEVKDTSVSSLKEETSNESTSSSETTLSETKEDITDSISTASSTPSSSSSSSLLSSSVTDSSTDTSTTKTTTPLVESVSSEQVQDVSSSEDSQTNNSIQSSIATSKVVLNDTGIATIHAEVPPSSSPSTAIATASAILPKKEGNTQESIYKTIMKRLSVLEHDMALSQRFLDDQNKILNDVFLDMEKKHQEQLMLLIGHLNETASQKIDTMKRRYEQWYEDLKEHNEHEMREMTTKISILADQLSFERRVSVSQLMIMIALFVFMALSRGTFSTLSPVMAAQQQEEIRKQQKVEERRQSDQEVPQKKTTRLPRRHSDSPFHTLHDSSPTRSISRHASSESMKDNLLNDILQKKLDDLLIEQQEK